MPTTTLEEAFLKRSSKFMIECLNLFLLIDNKEKIIMRLKERLNLYMKDFYRKV